MSITPQAEGLVLPAEYKYVVASLLPLVFLLLGQTLVVGKYRRKAGIKYPQLYADKAEAEASREAYIFNCAQRTHQNTLELLPVILITVLVSGITYPKLSAAASALFTVSRIAYTRGYITGDPEKRRGILGTLSSLSIVGLLLASAYEASLWVVFG